MPAGTSSGFAPDHFATAFTSGESAVHLALLLRYLASESASSLVNLTMKSLFAFAQSLLAMYPSNVALPVDAEIWPDDVITLPSFFTSARTGSQMNVAWMSPRAHAARTSGGRMLRICTSAGLIFACSSATIVWKWVVELNGTAIFLPLRSVTVLMPEPFLTTSASASPMSSRIQKTSYGSPRDSAAEMPAEPTSPICTAPEAIPLITSPPPPNCFQLTL